MPVAAASARSTPDGLDAQVSADARVIPAAENTTCARAITLRDGEVPAAATTAAPAHGLAGPASNALFYSVRVGAGEQPAVAAESSDCSMGTTSRGTGSAATVGILGGAGPFARIHAFQQAGAVRTGDARRFAP